MKIGDFHIHSTGSDGKLSPKEVVKTAISLKLPYICFTDHYPFPPGFESRFKDAERWSHFHNKKYYQKVLKLKQECKESLEVYFGAEFNWLEKYKDWTAQEVKKRQYDYALIAIHMLPKGDNPNPLNWTEEIFQQVIKDHSGTKNLVKEYYKQVRLAVQSDLFDCIAHFDLVKSWNKDSKYFDEDEEWYKEEVLKTLDVVEKHNIGIEINTSNYGPYYPVLEQCPSFWILKEAKKRNIPITIGSDAHKKEEIGAGLKRAANLAKQAGYDYIVKFKNRESVKVKI